MTRQQKFLEIARFKLKGEVFLPSCFQPLWHSTKLQWYKEGLPKDIYIPEYFGFDRTNFFPVKKTGRTALLVDYFKPIEGYDLDKNRYHLDFLLDVQIESIILDNGADELTPPGMRSLKEYLSIFGEKARLQRKKIGRHLELCKKADCLSSKLSAISFFLEFISCYAQKNPTKIKIMRFLLKDEMPQLRSERGKTPTLH